MGKYQIIYTDLPWSYQGNADDQKNNRGGAAVHLHAKEATAAYLGAAAVLHGEFSIAHRRASPLDRLQ